MENPEYERFCEEHGSFTQSALWAKVKKNWEHEYITVTDVDGKITAATLALYKRLPFGLSFMYAPRGFMCDFKNTEALSKLMKKVTFSARKRHAVMLKIDPLIDENDIASIESLKALGFAHRADCVGYENVQCRENYLLDIAGKTLDEVFAGFKPKWRYNIRLAGRKGVRCGFYGEEKLVDFMLLMRETALRDGFQSRNENYFKTLLNNYDGKAVLCMCYLGDKPLSGALMIEYAGTASYVYGCSSSDNRGCMPNYLMQWSMIKRAIHHGCRVYDFCGVPYWYDERHKNYGVYRFKSGFGGYVKTYAGEFDYIFRPISGRIFRGLWEFKKRG